MELQIADNEKSVNVNVTKPEGSNGALVTLDVYDPDFVDEGELYINGEGPIVLFGPKAGAHFDNQRTKIIFTTTGSWWNDGHNVLSFKRIKSKGFIIHDIEVNFLQVKQVVKPINKIYVDIVYQWSRPD